VSVMKINTVRMKKESQIMRSPAGSGQRPDTHIEMGCVMLCILLWIPASAGMTIVEGRPDTHIEAGCVMLCILLWIPASAGMTKRAHGQTWLRASYRCIRRDEVTFSRFR